MSATSGSYSEGNLGGDITGSDLVTGEAVALDMPAATLGMRALSGVLDVALNVVIGSTIVSIPIGMLAEQLDEAAAAAMLILPTVLTLVAIPTAFEAATGRTLAKLILGLRTLRDDGGPITFRHALTRHLVGLIEVYGLFASPALVCGMLNDRSKRLGDVAAGTYVVRDRVTAPRPKGGFVPRPLVPWARTADIAPLPDQLALSIRELLARAPQIRPEARLALAESMARQALPYVSPGPPRGTPPEVFLQALLVERGRRDWARLQREELLRRRLVGPRHPALTPPGGPLRG